MRSLSLIFVASVLASGLGAATTELRIVSPSSVTLAGSSNVNHWRCVGRTLSGTFQLPASRETIRAAAVEAESSGETVRPDGDQARHARLDLHISIKGLRCGNPVMEGDLRRTLNAKNFPLIRFAFDDLTGGLTFNRTTRSYTGNIVGTISLAGSSRQLAVTLHGTRTGDRIRLRATIPTRMTDFGLVPPTAFFGAVRANDSLEVSFDLLLEMLPSDDDNASQR